MSLRDMFFASAFGKGNGNGSGGASSWNDLPDKPFYDLPTGGDTLTWDGNTDGRYLVDFYGTPYAHVSDAVPSIDDLAKGMSITVSANGVQETGTLTADQFYDRNGVLSGDELGYYAFFVNEEAVAEHSEDPDFPQKAGTYFSFVPVNTYLAKQEYTTLSITIPGYAGYPSLKKLDKKYLPISSWEDLGSKYSAGYALPETTPAFNETEGYFTLLKPFTIYKGETYTVNWNGVDYTCQCVSATFASLPILGLGNIGAVTGGASTGEPFAVGVILEEYRDQAPFAVGIIPLDDSESVTLSVYGYTEIITPVPEKYLPENIGGSVYRITEEFTLNADSEAELTTSYDKFMPLLWNGGRVVLSQSLNGVYAEISCNHWEYESAYSRVNLFFQVNFQYATLKFPNGTWTPPV